MKTSLLAIGFALTAFPVWSQQFSENFNKSVFSKVHEIKSTRVREMALSQQKAKQHFPSMMTSVDKISGQITDVFGGLMSLPGQTVIDKAQFCISNHLSAFGINTSEWQMTGQLDAGHAHFVYFQQFINGHKVAFSRLSFRFTTDGQLQRIQLKHFGSPNSYATLISTATAENLLTQDLNLITIQSKSIDANWEWFAIPTTTGYELKPAYSYVIEGKGKNLPVHLTGFIDATNGDILYRQNKVKDIIDRSYNGMVYKQNPMLPASLEPMAEMALTINGNTYYTDSLGVFNDAILSSPITATVRLQGKWAKVNAVASGSVTPSFQDTILGNGVTITYPTAAPSSERHVNAYYHVTRVHDYMKGHYPTFTGMDIALPTNVDQTGGTCNAFYNGSSINFYPSGGGCNSFANCGDIIYHEYGHGINDKFYNWQGAGTMNNGGLNEGEADIWAISITHDPVLGKGSMPGTGGGMIRRYDQAPKVYPQDLVGEVHADGEIIAGAWWDVAVFAQDTILMGELFAKTLFDTPDGPDGTEGDVYHQVLISALTNDDNDNNLNNGTPHFNAIVAAFARHGIYLLGDAVVVHEEIAHQPTNTPIDITANVTVSTPAFLSAVKLFFRDRTLSWDSLVMNNTSGTLYSATIPGMAEGKIVDYYIALYDNLNIRSASFPEGYLPTLASNTITIPYQFGIGITKSFGFDFETTPANWTIGNASGDNATGGKWIVAKPIGSFVNGATGQLPVQPNYDHSTGIGGLGKCLVTGNATSTSSAIGSADVDGGKTTVITQTFDLTGMTEPVLEYYRWYTNNMGSNPGEDTWLVQAKDITASFWTTIENTKKSDNNWRRRILAVRKTLGIAGSNNLMLQYVASDAGAGGSIIEAAVDDVYLYDLTSVLSNGLDPQQIKASIYPNPAEDVVFINFNQPTEAKISVYDLTGKQLLSLDANVSTSHKLNIGGIPNGTYFIQIKTMQTVQSQKLTIMH